jgi:nucleotide-binding universal stress UspA family protein
MIKLTYFVPVDFTDCSFNALQYALMLARFSEGKVMIGHVIDLDLVTESENPVVVTWSLENLNRKANEKMKSLREMISLEGVEVEHDISTGNVRIELMKQIDRLTPNVIVIGRDTDMPLRKDSLVSYFTRNTRIPVMVVPGTHNPTLPNRAVLATDMKPEKMTEFDTFFNLLKRTSQELAIVNISGKSSGSQVQAEIWVDKLKAVYGIEATLLTQRNGKDLKDLMRANKVDLLCTIRRNKNILDRFFQRNTTHQLPALVEVPVLMINE